jgi:putative tricarboxylic transport membrane protein
MKTIYTICSLILTLIGSIFCISSLSLGLGEINAPGPGLIPFGAGACLILLSVGTILETCTGTEMESKPQLFEGRRWVVSMWVLFSLFGYALVLDILGFIPATFLLITSLLKVSEKQSWKVALGVSILITAFTYLIFDYLIKMNLPKGFVWF